jgi:hypothetical protein
MSYNTALVLLILLTIGPIYLVYLAGRIAERRGRSFTIWAWIAVIIGPFAFPLLFLFRNLPRRHGDRA